MESVLSEKNRILNQLNVIDEELENIKDDDIKNAINLNINLVKENI